MYLSPPDLAEQTEQLLAAGRRDGGSGLAAVAALIGARFDGGCVIFLRSGAHHILVPAFAFHSEPVVAAKLDGLVSAQPWRSGRRMLAVLEAGGSVLVSGTPAHIEAWLGGANETAQAGLRSVLAVPVEERDAGVVGAIVVGRLDEVRYDVPTARRSRRSRPCSGARSSASGWPGAAPARRRRDADRA